MNDCGYIFYLEEKSNLIKEINLPDPVLLLFLLIPGITHEPN